MTRCAFGESMLAIVAVAGPHTASRPRDIGIPPVAIWICFGSSGDSTPTKSAPCFSTSGISSGRLTIPAILRWRDFAIAIRQRAIWELAALMTIHSLGLSFTNSSKRRTAVVGLIFNIEAALASIEGGTTKRPWAGARTFSDQVNVPNGIVTRSPALTLVTPTPTASTIPSPSPRSEKHTPELHPPDHLVCRL